jgi:hypothetical protein
MTAAPASKFQPRQAPAHRLIGPPSTHPRIQNRRPACGPQGQEDKVAMYVSETSPGSPSSAFACQSVDHQTNDDRYAAVLRGQSETSATYPAMNRFAHPIQASALCEPHPDPCRPPSKQRPKLSLTRSCPEAGFHKILTGSHERPQPRTSRLRVPGARSQEGASGGDRDRFREELARRRGGRSARQGAWRSRVLQ